MTIIITYSARLGAIAFAANSSTNGDNTQIPIRTVTTGCDLLLPPCIPTWNRSATDAIAPMTIAVRPIRFIVTPGVPDERTTLKWILLRRQTQRVSHSPLEHHRPRTLPVCSLRADAEHGQAASSRREDPRELD